MEGIRHSQGDGTALVAGRVECLRNWNEACEISAQRARNLAVVVMLSSRHGADSGGSYGPCEFDLYSKTRKMNEGLI